MQKEKEIKMKRSKEYACEFKNEAECEEELEDDGINLDEAEKEYFDEEE